MPLLQGKFDPLRLNSTELGQQIYESQVAVDEALKGNYAPLQIPCLWRETSDSVKQAYIDIAQHVLDNLMQSGVIL